MKDFLDTRVIAVVGASRDPNKYGYKIFVYLLRKNKRVYPVNPKAEKIAGVKAYPSLSALPEKPDLVITVVPSSVTEKVVDECIKLGIKQIWMQPGSESMTAIKKAQNAGIDVIYNLCFIVGGLKENFEF